MINENFNRLSEIIEERISNQKSVSDEQLNEYMNYIFANILSKQSFPEKFKLLRDTLLQTWDYGQFDEKERSYFFLGALFSGASLSLLAEKEIDRLPKLHEEARANQNHIKLFYAIKENPGITHKELADEADMTASTLSQWMSKNAYKNYFSFSRIGREKYYYMEDYGDQVLAEMQSQNANHVTSAIVNLKILEEASQALNSIFLNRRMKVMSIPSKNRNKLWLSTMAEKNDTSDIDKHFEAFLAYVGEEDYSDEKLRSRSDEEISFGGADREEILKWKKQPVSLQ